MRILHWMFKMNFAKPSKIDLIQKMKSFALFFFFKKNAFLTKCIQNGTKKIKHENLTEFDGTYLLVIIPTASESPSWSFNIWGKSVIIKYIYVITFGNCTKVQTSLVYPRVGCFVILDRVTTGNLMISGEFWLAAGFFLSIPLLISQVLSYIYIFFWLLKNNRNFHVNTGYLVKTITVRRDTINAPNMIHVKTIQC